MDDEAPQTSTTRASGIGPYFRPDLLQVSEEDDDDQPAPQQSTPTLPTALATQVCTVHHLQHGWIEEGLALVGSLASQMNEEHTSFRDVIHGKLLAIQSEQKRTADGLVDLQKLLAAEGRPRHEEHQQLMGALNIMATSVTKLVENAACEHQVSQSMELSQRNSSAPLEVMAAAFKMISEILSGMSKQLATLHPPPPPASQTPPAHARTASWYGQSQLYQGYTLQYPVMLLPAAQPTTAQKSSRRKKRRKKKMSSSSSSSSSQEQGSSPDKDQ